MERYIHKVRYYESDAMGITHHSNYIRFMEEARIDALDRAGYGFEKMEADGVSSPVVKCFIALWLIWLEVLLQIRCAKVFRLH